MTNITLNELNAENLYSTLLQTIEDLCDRYDLLNHFGTISTANQQVVDFILNSSNNFSMDVLIELDNDVVSFSYYLTDSLLSSFINFSSGVSHEYDVLSLLADNLEYNAENKSFTISFHVKPKFSIQRDRISQIKHKTINTLK